MPKLHKTEVQGLLRDESNHALINTDKEGLLAYKKRKQQFRKIGILEAKCESMEKRIEDLEKKITGKW